MPKAPHNFTQQRFTPEFIKWDEEAFQSDLYVARRMTPTQRNMYRALCQAGMWCSTRPYLPTDDEELCLLADAESLEHWLANKDVIMKKFSQTEHEGQQVWANKRMLAEWEYIMEVVAKNRERASKGGRARAEKAKQGTVEACEHSWMTTPKGEQLCRHCAKYKSEVDGDVDSSDTSKGKGFAYEAIEYDDEPLEWYLQATSQKDFAIEELEN